MNIVRLNTTAPDGVMNQVFLNLVGIKSKREDVPSGDIPAGYETFLATDGDFLAADGELYVKL